MIGVTELTRALAAAPSTSVDEGVRGQLREGLSSRIASSVDRLGPGEQVVVTLPLLRQARRRPESLAHPQEAFAWKPAFVRRSLGLAVVSACASGRFRTPAVAAGPVAEEAVTEWERTGWRTFHWEPWLAGLASGGRAMVLADAASWATSLWLSLDWSVLPRPPQIGGADDQWICPASRTVRLKGRCELRLALADGPVVAVGGNPGDAPVALVSVSSGCPGVAWEEELGYLALVAGLRSPARPVPARVVGLWPDAGAYRITEVDNGVLLAAAERVVATVRAMVDAAPARTAAR